MYTVAIVDDMREDARALANMIAAADIDPAGVPSAVPLGTERFQMTYFDSPLALAAKVARGYEPDIAIFDIVFDRGSDAPDADGVLAVERMLEEHPEIQVIYMSGYDSFHTKVYRTPHVAYLSKPFHKDDVAYAMRLAVEALERHCEQPLCLHAKGVDHIISPGSIRYLESKLHTVYVHTAQGTIEIYGKLSDLLEQLPARFVRCHQSFAVNLDAVTSLDTSTVTVLGGPAIPVSRRMRAGVREALFAHLRGKRH